MILLLDIGQKQPKSEFLIKGSDMGEQDERIFILLGCGKILILDIGQKQPKSEFLIKGSDMGQQGERIHSFY